MINIFINEIIELLKRENEDRKRNDKYEIDIPFNIITLEQSLGLDSYKELIDDLGLYNFDISYVNTDEEYYSNGEINIYLTKSNDDEYGREQLNKTYKIILNEEPRDWGYCQCEKGDADYEARYDCCGHGCDWTAPSFSIVKMIALGNNSFNGDANEFWKYSDKFHNVSEKEKEESNRQSEIARVKREIESLNRQLENLNK